jgi:hypothetical protein
MKAKAKARLTFEVEMDLDSAWGGDCTAICRQRRFIVC